MRNPSLTLHNGVVDYVFLYIKFSYFT